MVPVSHSSLVSTRSAVTRRRRDVSFGKTRADAGAAFEFLIHPLQRVGGAHPLLVGRKGAPIRPKTQWCAECPSISLVLWASDVVNGEVCPGPKIRGGLTLKRQLACLSKVASDWWTGGWFYK